MFSWNLYKLRIDNDSSIESLIRKLVVALFIVPLLMGIVFTLNIYNTKTIDEDKVNLTLLAESIQRVKSNFNSMEDTIKTESRSIENIFSEIKNELNKKNEELLEIKKREEDLVKQVAHYTSLVSLSEEQVSAINNSLNSSKNTDLFISFILGIFASFLSSLLFKMKFIRKIFEGK